MRMLWDLCFKRGSAGEIRRYGGQPVYGEYAYPRQWCSMLSCLRDHGLADELKAEKPEKSVFFLRHGGAVGSEARAVLQVWSLLASSIEWLLTEPSCSD